jgi:subtilisin family serine protease
MKLHRYCAALLAVLCVFGTGSMINAHVAPALTRSMDIPSFSELQKKAQTGKVMVIFALNAGALGSSENTLALASFEAEPAQITSGQARLVKLLEIAKVEAIKPVWGLPLIAARVDAAQLAAIMQSSLVAAVYEDRLSPPSLSRSVPHIGTPILRAVGLRGEGQVVAVLDTGTLGEHSFFYDQSILRSKVYDEACFSSRVTGVSMSVCPGYVNTLQGQGSTIPCDVVSSCYHGTHVAGIAVGKANPDAAFDGVAPEARLMSVQVFSLMGTSAANTSLVAYDSDILSGLSYVRSRRLAGEPIAAINISIGGSVATGPCNSSPFETIIAILKRLDVATVIASGNDGMSNGVAAFACPPSAVVVGSSSLSDAISTFSNSSPLLDLLAPGEAIVSSISRTRTSYRANSGTSMAAPHVAGSFALLRQQFPCTPIGVIENALKVGGVSVTHPTTGAVYKRINLAGALHHLRFVETKYRCPVVNDSNSATGALTSK